MIGVVLATALIAQDRPALSISGNDIWYACSEQTGQGTACTSYVAGVLDTYATFESLLSDSNYCVPDRATYDQVTDVVVEYIRKNPGQRHRPGALLVLWSVRDAFGCNEAGRTDPPITLPIEPSGIFREAD